MAGSVPEPHVVSEDGARFRVHLLRGLNHGFFLDMAEGRRWVRRRWRRGRGKVLNLFAYTCAFSVVALQAGAGQVVNVDMSRRRALHRQAQPPAQRAGSGASFLPHDIFASWGKITRSGPYDLVILDPPSYQKGSFVAEKDYARLVRRLPDLLAPGGQALLCLNSPKLGADFLHGLMAEHAPAMLRRAPANPPAFADVAPERALKVLVYRAPG
jgi:23S rRNA (cytosine1962-C5)-methyltransferase